ncbi:MAG: hypothetical protein JW779_09820 [Candidatus Thorarchaeota archaeon]|nr:hypothetical protein [Candidatus Thorarchaeota archaeon]
MSSKKSSIPSLKSLEKECDAINFPDSKQILIVTSPFPEATLAAAILSKGIMKSDGLFHVTTIQPVLSIDQLNDLRSRYESSSIILIGIDIFGGKKRVKKGNNYPLFIGGETDSDQIASLRFGTDSTLPATAYVLTKSQTEPTMYELALAVAGSVIYEGIDRPKKGANKDIIELADKEGIIEKHTGFRLFGMSMHPLDETILYSTNPYLQSISGNQRVCDEILSNSEIPLPKYRKPLSELTDSEAQRLSSNLIPYLDLDIIPQLWGTDFIFTSERGNSPLRYASGFEIIASTSWARHEIGSSLSVWLGDRGRSLRQLLDNHISHHKDVISTVQRLASGVKGESTTSATTVKLPGVKSEILFDVGRVALEIGIVDSDRPLILDNDESYTIVWPPLKLGIKHVLHRLLGTQIHVDSLSSHSVRVIGTSETKETVLQKIIEMHGASSK